MAAAHVRIEGYCACCSDSMASSRVLRFAKWVANAVAD